MQETHLPQHIAIIMDGNRRWARQHKLKIIAGHRQVAEERIDELVEYCIKLSIPYLTLWAFSTENWNRDPEEVGGIIDLLRETLGTSLEKLHRKGVRVNTIGDLSRFDQDIQQQLGYWRRETAGNQQITVTFALNYGGRDEIVRAVKAWGNDVLASAQKSNQDLQKKIEQFSEGALGKYLDTSELPDPDLIIRPGREKRLSGFLTWQSVYSELYFSDTLMPDFDSEELQKALDDYAQRKRRFGR